MSVLFSIEYRVIVVLLFRIIWSVRVSAIQYRVQSVSGAIQNNMECSCQCYSEYRVIRIPHCTSPLPMFFSRRKLITFSARTKSWPPT